MKQKQTKTTTGAKSAIKELAILFSVPAAAFLAIIALAYLPQQRTNPAYDFIYAKCESEACAFKSDDMIDYDDGSVKKETPRDDVIEEQIDRSATFYRYDVTNDAVSRLTELELRALSIDTSLESPDGYVLERSNNDYGDWLFWGTNGGAKWYLKKEFAKQRAVSIGPDEGYWIDGQEIKLIGWVQHDN